jgi:tRNA A37 threonylcarbamoyladenosine dehydratase
MWTLRTELLLGGKTLEKYKRSKVLVVGIGGVGGMCVECLVRAGIGNITIVDADIINETNINRQIIALQSNIGKLKVDAMLERAIQINPNINIQRKSIFIDETNITNIFDQDYDYVVDAIDTIAPKVALIRETLFRKIPLVSSMGAGAKLDPMAIKITDISKSYYCPLARTIRKRLHPMGIRKGFQVVFSPEESVDNATVLTEGERNKKSMVGTISYLPLAFGTACASVVLRALMD